MSEKLTFDAISGGMSLEDLLETFTSNCKKTYGKKAADNLMVRDPSLFRG